MLIQSKYRQGFISQNTRLMKSRLIYPELTIIYDFFADRVALYVCAGGIRVKYRANSLSKEAHQLLAAVLC